MSFRSPAPAVQSPPRLTVEHVSKRFRGLAALDDVSLTIAPDEIVGLIGPNGSGKTTLLNVISGVLPPTDGTVRVDGEVVSTLPPFRVARHGVGRTFQQIRLFPELTVAENVEFGAVARGRRQVGAMLSHIVEVLELSDESDLPAGTLSYGHQRRVEIARALAGAPTVLLLDEPAAGMNEEESDHLLRLIQTLHAELSCAVLIVEHDLHLMMRLCHRLYVLAGGRVISEGSPAHVTADPAVIDAYVGRRRSQGSLARAGSASTERCV